MKRGPHWTIAVAVLVAQESSKPLGKQAPLADLMGLVDDIEFCRWDRNQKDKERRAPRDVTQGVLR